MLVGIWLVFKDRITIGQVIESSQLMAYVTGPLLNFTDIMTSFKSAKPVQNKVINFISEEKPVEVEDEFEFNNLKLNNISFKYPTSDKYVLKNLDFTFEKGKKYIIIGESGTGDSDIMMTDTINPLKSKFKGFHKTFKQDDLGLSLSSFLLN